MDFIKRTYGSAYHVLDRAQVSVCFPGYPQPWHGESDAAHRYRVKRCTAHIDGLLREGAEKRRHLREHHAFILGIPMLDVPATASPVVVWEGSHRIVQQAFQRKLKGIAVDEWGDQDITQFYHSLRERIFDGCTPTEVAARPGECYIVHRLALHGVRPWHASAEDSTAEGRMISYFRPELTSKGDWLLLP